MNVDIRNLSSDSIVELATKMSNTVSEIEAAVKAIQDAITATVPNMWDGQAAMVFRDNWERDYQAYQKQMTDFSNLVETLKKIAADVDTAESSNAQLAAYHG